MILRVLDRRPEAVIVEFLEQPRDRRPFHVVLVERLDGGEPRGGTGKRAGLGHCAGALAAACAARKGPSAAATSLPASHGAKWPALVRRTIVRSSTSLSRPS